MSEIKIDGVVVKTGDKILIKPTLSTWEKILRFFGKKQKHGVYVVTECGEIPK